VLNRSIEYKAERDDYHPLVCFTAAPKPADILTGKGLLVWEEKKTPVQ